MRYYKNNGEIFETEAIFDLEIPTENEILEWKNKKKKLERIAELKEFLVAADYWGQKYIDGEYTPEEWEEKKAQRKAWREEIRSLENSVDSDG